MDRFARVVLGFHGCEPAFATALVRGEISLEDWKRSENAYDWLGHGIYFWEHAPERARAWGKGGVVGAVIQLGRCLDLTDVAYTALLTEQHERLVHDYKNQGRDLPENRGKRRELDCLVINQVLANSEQGLLNFQTVRCAFLEGAKVFPGSEILAESHIQISVRDPQCILGIFRPTFPSARS